MSGLIRICMLASSLVFANPAAAQDRPKNSEGSEIVVTGNRDLRGQIRDFVEALTPAPGHDQLSRFEWEVCPVAVGLSQAQKEAVAGRMRRIAGTLGMRVGGATCVPNTVLVVTRDKKAFMEDIRRRHPYYFGDIPARQVRRLVQEPGPATAWHVQGPPLDANGVEIQRTRLGDSPVEVYVNETTTTGSRITAAARPHFAAAMVVVQADALVGLTTTQLADYAAMRVFAKTDPSRLRDVAAPTILEILDAPMGSAVPLTLTEWDMGFLRALYTSAPNLYAAGQRSSMRRHLEKELEPVDGRRD